MIHIKSEREIALIRESCRYVVDVFRKVGEVICEGMTTRDIDHFVDTEIKKNGGKAAFKGYKLGNAVFPASCCISIEDEVVHGIPGKRKLKNGQIVSIDIGIIYRDFVGDSAKTFAIGEIDHERKHLMATTLEALYEGIEKAVTGNRLSNVSHAIQKHVEAAGFSVVKDLVGHGVGRKLHEEPQIPNYGKPNRGPKLRTGMVLAIEPMVNAGKAKVFTADDDWTVLTKDGRPSAHFEHAIVVREGEAEILTLGV